MVAVCVVGFSVPWLVVGSQMQGVWDVRTTGEAQQRKPVVDARKFVESSAPRPRSVEVIVEPAER